MDIHVLFPSHDRMAKVRAWEEEMMAEDEELFEQESINPFSDDEDLVWMNDEPKHGYPYLIYGDPPRMLVYPLTEDEDGQTEYQTF